MRSVARLAVVTIALMLAASGCKKDEKNAQPGAAPGRTPGAPGAGGSGGGGPGGAAGPAGMRRNDPVPVTITSAAEQDVPIYLDGLGTVQAFNTASVKPQVSGTLIAVPLVEGQEVKKGAVLARIDPRTFQASLDQALARKAQNVAALEQARVNLKRFQELSPAGYVSAQEVETQKVVVTSAEAQLKSDDAAIETARIQLSFCTVTAPFDGIVGIRLLDVGNVISSGTALVSITQIKPVSVTFTLPEQNLADVREASLDGAPLVIAMSRDNSGELARGQLAAVDNLIDQTTGTIKLKAQFDNADKALWPGQFVNTRLLARTLEGRVTVPSQAAQLGPTGNYIYVVTGDAEKGYTAEMRTVKLGQVTATYTVIEDGLRAGESVVIDGQSRLRPGAKVLPGTPPEVKSEDAEQARRAMRRKRFQQGGQNGQRGAGGPGGGFGGPGGAGGTREERPAGATPNATSGNGPGAGGTGGWNGQRREGAGNGSAGGERAPGANGERRQRPAGEAPAGERPARPEGTAPAARSTP